MKPKFKYPIIGCNFMWGKVTEETAKYCNKCEHTQGAGDCKTDLMVLERSYIFLKTQV
jgi:hypothetical protein